MSRSLVARVISLHRYPVKSMAGEELDTVEVGWHGLAGDRRLAFVRRNAAGGFPWLTASKLPSLITYTPLRAEGVDSNALPTNVRTPDGRMLELRGENLRQEVSAAHGADVELLQVDNGIFDDAQLSIISKATIGAIAVEAGLEADARRFRPNLLVETLDPAPFSEGGWVGRTISVGESGPALIVAQHDIRCMMINLRPDSAIQDPSMLRATVRLNENRAGVYANVIRTGTIAVGDPIYLD